MLQNYRVDGISDIIHDVTTVICVITQTTKSFTIMCNCTFQAQCQSSVFGDTKKCLGDILCELDRRKFYQE